MALQGWLSLAPMVFRGMRKLGWTGLRDRARGAWELASVATSGLAIVFVEARILFLALIFWVLALGVYCAMTAFILWRAGSRRVDPSGRAARPLDRDGWPRDRHAGGRSHPPCVVSRADRRCGALVTIVTWALASLWIVPLAVIGWRRIRDWPAVFPLGMYSSATFAMALETGWSALRVVSLVFFWIALADWLLTLPRFVQPHPR